MTEILSIPSSYTGIHQFHKYWEKKPLDVVSDIVEKLCPEDGTVIDPFMGYGSIAHYCKRI